MGRWLGWVEQRLTCPDVFDVVDTQMWVLEQVADLVIDLERPFIVKEIGIEPFLSHVDIVLQVTTDDYVICSQVDPSLRTAVTLERVGPPAQASPTRASVRAWATGPGFPPTSLARSHS